MRISKQTIKTFEIESGLHLFFGFGMNTRHYQLTELERGGWDIRSCTSCQILGFDKDTGKYICIKFNAPKNKEMTTSYLFDKVEKTINKENTYNTLRLVFKKMLPSYAFYATSYGVGMDALFRSHESVIEATQGLRDFLDENKIEYKNEYSEAAWVYRFVISKSSENIERINAL